jgi:hypothetical protein
LAKVRTTWGKASDRLRQRKNKRNKNLVGHLPTSERNRKLILSDEVRRRIGKGWHMYFNHLRLIITTVTVGDRAPRNICQELTITALPGNWFTVPPRKTKQKTSIVKHEYPQSDTVTPPPPRDHNSQLFKNIFYTVYTFYIRVTF